MDKLVFKKLKLKLKQLLCRGCPDSRTGLKHIWLRLQNPVFLNFGTPGFRDISSLKIRKRRVSLDGAIFTSLQRSLLVFLLLFFTVVPKTPTPSVVSTVCLGPSSLLQTRCSELRINIYIPEGWSPDGLWEPPVQQPLLKLKRLENKPEYSC